MTSNMKFGRWSEAALSVPGRARDGAQSGNAAPPGAQAFEELQKIEAAKQAAAAAERAEVAAASRQRAANTAAEATAAEAARPEAVQHAEVAETWVQVDRPGDQDK